MPSVFATLKPTLMSPKSDSVGFIDYAVTKSGWVFFLGHLAGEGSPGPWQDDRWDEKRLQQEGWTEITDAEMGAKFVQAENGMRTWKSPS